MNQIGRNRSIWRQVMALIAVFAVILFSAYGSILIADAHESHPTATPMAGMPMPQEFDLVFIDLMIAHHQSAIAMAEVALTEGEHHEIRDLAKGMVDGQQAELDRLRTWRADWYPDAPVTSADQLHDHLAELLHSPGHDHLDSADAAAEALHHVHGPFDQAFLEQMLPHHQSTITLAQIALQQAVHPEIAVMAQEILDTQQREISDMQRWLTEWYGGTPIAAENAQPVEVTLSDFAITAIITEFAVGQPYQFSITNSGAIPHEFMIMPKMDGMETMEMADMHDVALLMISEDDLLPGVTQTVEVTFAEPAATGELEFVCAVPGHLDAGMRLPITVV